MRIRTKESWSRITNTWQRTFDKLERTGSLQSGFIFKMDSAAVTVPLRPPTKKMKKRKELDALAPPHAVSRRSNGKRSSQVSKISRKGAKILI